MTINKAREEGKLTVAISGRLDTTTAPELDAALAPEYEGLTELTFDLEGLEYISSAGLRVLLSAQKIMNNQGKMEVKNAQETVMEVFEVTGFTDILTIV